MIKQETTRLSSEVAVVQIQPPSAKNDLQVNAKEQLQEILNRYPDLAGVPATVILTSRFSEDCAGGCG
jgi:hypothetical protein